MASSFLTASDVAAQAKVSPRTIVRWAKAGRLPHVHKLPGDTGAYLFDPGAVQMFIRTLHQDAA